MFAPAKENGMTLVELLVAMGMFTVILALSFTCISSGQNQASDIRKKVDIQEAGRLVISDIEYQLRGGSTVKVDKDGKTLAFISSTDEAIAYSYDEKQLTLVRYIRRFPGSEQTQMGRLFRRDIIVKSCSFEALDGCVAMSLTLCQREKQKSGLRGDSVTIQGRAALRIAE